MRPAAAVVCSAFLMAAGATAQLKDSVKPYVKEDARVLVLNHVRVIDGTGAAPMEDQRIDIENGKITRVQSAKLRNGYPPNASVLDLTGKTVMPGIVGMHEHLFYTTPSRIPDGLPLWTEIADSGPRLYLAGGVTTARTAGSMEPYTDLGVKQMIDAGTIPGPKMNITGPYLGGYLGKAPQMHTLSDPEDAGRTVDYWAAEGVTSFKAYMDISPEELKTAIDHSHAKGLKLTGHLCSVGFREAAAMGIDNLEHGIVADTEFFPGKKPGVCPADGAEEDFAKNLDIESAAVQSMIRDLVAHHVAVTSTLAVFEVTVPNRPPLATVDEGRKGHDGRSMGALPAGPRDACGKSFADRRSDAQKGDAVRTRLREGRRTSPRGVRSDLIWRRCAGLWRPARHGTAGGGWIHAGGGDPHRDAKWGDLPGQQAEIGSVAEGHAADLIVLDGNPAEKIDDVEKVETVFKDGVGYDPAKLRASVAGLVGIR